MLLHLENRKFCLNTYCPPRRCQTGALFFRELVNDPTVFNQQSEIKNMALTIVIRDEDIEVELERRKKQGDMVCKYA